MGRRHVLMPRAVTAHKPRPLDGCGRFRSYQREGKQQMQTQDPLSLRPGCCSPLVGSQLLKKVGVDKPSYEEMSNENYEHARIHSRGFAFFDGQVLPANDGSQARQS